MPFYVHFDHEPWRYEKPFDTYEEAVKQRRHLFHLQRPLPPLFEHQERALMAKRFWIATETGEKVPDLTPRVLKSVQAWLGAGPQFLILQVPVWPETSEQWLDHYSQKERQTGPATSSFSVPVLTVTIKKWADPLARAWWWLAFDQYGRPVGKSREYPMPDYKPYVPLRGVTQVRTVKKER